MQFADYDKPGRRIFSSSAIMPIARLPSRSPMIWWMNLVPVLLRLFNMSLLSLRVNQIRTPIKANSDKEIIFPVQLDISSD